MSKRCDIVLRANVTSLEQVQIERILSCAPIWHGYISHFINETVSFGPKYNQQQKIENTKFKITHALIQVTDVRRADGIRDQSGIGIQIVPQVTPVFFEYNRQGIVEN